jgi:23S rRNA U2552 (ribose-2'-O)-methylase RlmE/FtsJ
MLRTRVGKVLRAALGDDRVESLKAASGKTRQEVRWRGRRAVESARGTNPLLRYFETNEDRLIHKWMHYFDVYHTYFDRFRGRDIVVVEIGVFHGGSLQMWRDYFGPRARIWGVDIDSRCKAFEGPRITIVLGDQGDRDFLRRLAETVGPVDILIDDGGHTMDQQIATFEELYSLVKVDGIYLVEDTHTSYWPEEYGGGYRTPGTFMEYAKGLVDKLNAWHSRTPDLVVDDFTSTTRAIHFYDSIVVFEKGGVTRPGHRMTGRPSF